MLNFETPITYPDEETKIAIIKHFVLMEVNPDPGILYICIIKNVGLTKHYYTLGLHKHDLF